MSNSRCPVSNHGSTSGRGCSHAAVGSFGRMFPELDSQYFSDEALQALGLSGGLMHDKSGRSKNSDIPAAYTFFAQFVDHDITLDVESQLNSTTIQDPKGVSNLRTMSLDLDCVYGFGPEASPFLYDSDEHLLTGNPTNENDLRRVVEAENGKVTNVGTALIGDPRNDENLFVSQLQFAFHLFHNKLLDELCDDFELAQSQARYHYQYIVLHDFLKRVCDEAVFRFAIQRIYSGDYPLIFTPDVAGALEMPVEFSVAAYRFGHTLVRDKYQPNSKIKRIELFQDMSNGFEAIPPKLTVEWIHLFEKGTLARSKGVDELFASELIRLPDNVIGADTPENERSLPFRNLLRSRSLGLPSGRDVADVLASAGYPVDPMLDLKLSSITGWGSQPAAIKAELTDAQPLFFYLLRESNVVNKGLRLGPVASAILMEVFGGILTHCENSFLHADFAPISEIVGEDQNLTLADILRYVGVYERS